MGWRPVARANAWPTNVVWGTARLPGDKNKKSKKVHDNDGNNNRNNSGRSVHGNNVVWITGGYGNVVWGTGYGNVVWGT